MGEDRNQLHDGAVIDLGAAEPARQCGADKSRRHQIAHRFVGQAAQRLGVKCALAQHRDQCLGTGAKFVGTYGDIRHSVTPR